MLSFLFPPNSFRCKFKTLNMQKKPKSLIKHILEEVTDPLMNSKPSHYDSVTLENNSTNVYKSMFNSVTYYPSFIVVDLIYLETSMPTEMVVR